MGMRVANATHCRSPSNRVFLFFRSLLFVPCFSLHILYASAQRTSWQKEINRLTTRETNGLQLVSRARVRTSIWTRTWTAANAERNGNQRRSTLKRSLSGNSYNLLFSVFASLFEWHQPYTWPSIRVFRGETWNLHECIWRKIGRARRSGDMQKMFVALISFHCSFCFFISFSTRALANPIIITASHISAFVWICVIFFLNPIYFRIRDFRLTTVSRGKRLVDHRRDASLAQTVVLFSCNLVHIRSKDWNESPHTPEDK